MGSVAAGNGEGRRGLKTVLKIVIFKLKIFNFQCPANDLALTSQRQLDNEDDESSEDEVDADERGETLQMGRDLRVPHAPWLFQAGGRSGRGGVVAEDDPEEDENHRGAWSRTSPSRESRTGLY